MSDEPLARLGSNNLDSALDIAMSEEFLTGEDLTIDQINVIMSSLGNAPFIQVEGIINEIRKQVQPQLAPEKAPPE